MWGWRCPNCASQIWDHCTCLYAYLLGHGMKCVHWFWILRAGGVLQLTKQVCGNFLPLKQIGKGCFGEGFLGYFRSTNITIKLLSHAIHHGPDVITNSITWQLPQKYLDDSLPTPMEITLSMCIVLMCGLQELDKTGVSYCLSYQEPYFWGSIGSRWWGVTSFVVYFGKQLWDTSCLEASVYNLYVRTLFWREQVPITSSYYAVGICQGAINIPRNVFGTPGVFSHGEF